MKVKVTWLETITYQQILNFSDAVAEELLHGVNWMEHLKEGELLDRDNSYEFQSDTDVRRVEKA